MMIKGKRLQADSLLSPKPRLRFLGLPATFWLAVASCTFFFAAVQALFPVLPRYVLSIGGGASGVGLMVIVTSIPALLSRLPAGALSDRWGRKPFMLVGGALATLAPLLYTANHSLGLFLWGRALVGAGISIYTTPYKALIADLAPPERRGFALGVSNMAFPFALAVGPLIGDALQHGPGGYQAAFVSSAAGAALATALALFLPSSPRSGNSGPRSFLNGLDWALKRRGLWAGLVGMAGVAFPFTLTITYMPLLAEERNMLGGGAGLTALGVGGAFTAYALMNAIGEPIGGRLSDRYGRLSAAAPAALIMTASLWLTARATTLGGIYFASAVMGLGFSALRTAQDTIIQDAMAPALRGTGAALQYAVYDLTIGLSGWGMGLIAAASSYSALYQGTLWIFVALEAVAVWLAWGLQPYRAAIEWTSSR